MEKGEKTNGQTSTLFNSLIEGTDSDAVNEAVYWCSSPPVIA